MAIWLTTGGGGATMRGMTSKPPKPPSGSYIRISPSGELSAPKGWGQWRAPAAEVTVQTVDNTGRRVTATRAVMMGPLALAAKKRSGTVSVILTRASDGDTLVHEVRAKLAEAVLTWAVAFNAWRDAVADG
ncbi:hypothetical protein LN042_11240 [Kitasatospora sp. RB6PN24]|uniref:hypothetical protein n=1 Tax=Kitasatospora humi TaxID=2893891 RepID=UPI001E37B286|nr:hypothetical protein [Kitasatospora humi]MCC9307669.1 hypothetical protein [Kitasatospora humi]